MSALLKKRAKERAAALARRQRGEDGSGDEGGEEVEELAIYKVRMLEGGVCFAFLEVEAFPLSSCVRRSLRVLLESCFRLN